MLATDQSIEWHKKFLFYDRKFLTLFFFLFASSVYSNAQSFFWTRNASGISYDVGYSVCTDSNGDAITTGVINSPSVSFGSTVITNLGSFNIFLAKYDVNGNLAWAKSAGGSGSDWANSVTSDRMNNVLITGPYYSSVISFDTTTLTNSGWSNVFLAKYDANGNVLWAKSSTGTGQDQSYGVKADTAGNSFVVGEFYGPTISFDTITLTNTGGSNFFLVKYDAAGNVLWAKSAIGSLNDRGTSVSCDRSGNAYVCGYFTSPTITFGTVVLNNFPGAQNMFVVKYDPAGNVIWARTGGGMQGGDAKSISTDPDGNSYVTGTTYDTMSYFNSTPIYNNGFYNSFLVKYDSTGSVVWANCTGGDANGTNSVSVLGNRLFVTGFMDGNVITFGSGFLMNPYLNAFVFPLYICEYDTSGNDLCAAVLDTRSVGISAVSADNSGNAFLTGSFDFNPFIVGNDTINSSTGGDIFVSKYTCQANGIENPALGESENIFPNPAGNVITITVNEKSRNDNYTLTDAAGRSVMGGKLNGETTQINIEILAPGIYFFKCVESMQTIKLIKK